MFGRRPTDEQMGLSAEICEKHRSYLVHLAFQVTRNMTYTEDVVQNTICKLIFGNRKLQDMSDIELKKYMSRAVVNNAITYMSEINRRNEIPLSELPPTEIEDLALQEVLSVETSAQLKKCLNKLSPRQKQVLTLAYLEEWDTKQIAEELGIKPVGVRAVKKRGLAKLQDLCKREGFEK